MADTAIHELLLQYETAIALALILAKLKKTRRRYYRFSPNGRDENCTRRQAIQFVEAEIEARVANAAQAT